MGELHPAFGNQPALLALTRNGDPLDRAGFAPLVVPNDALRGRRVSNLATLQVLRVEPARANRPWWVFVRLRLLV
jgi:hypothetical protein